jgi:signal transduction histidine kinase
VLRYGDDALDLEVLDDGNSTRSNGAGHGLIGMRERVAMLGGEFRAGARRDGGFAVFARLPIAGPAA